VRAEFEVYRKDVEVETKTGKRNYKLLPLSGRHFPKLMSVVSKFPQGDDVKNDEFLKALDEETVGKLHSLVFETLKYSLSVKDDKELEELDLFVSQNLFGFIPALIEVNFGSEKE
jgi:hypothetical protein